MELFQAQKAKDRFPPLVVREDSLYTLWSAVESPETLSVELQCTASRTSFTICLELDRATVAANSLVGCLGAVPDPA